MTKLKDLVSKEEIESAQLTGEEEVEKLNPWAKGQKNHKSNEYREIYDEDGQTQYCVHGSSIVMNPDLI